MALDGWKDQHLSDVATIVGGGTPRRSRPAYWDGDIPWATPTDVTGLLGRTISKTASTITDAGLASSSATLLPPNSLLMTTRATIGACAINEVSMATNQGFQNLVPKQSSCVDFLYYLIRHHKRKLERLAAGSTFLEVSKRAIRGFRVRVPPLPEQRKIAAILSSVDDAIEKTKAVIDQVQVVKRGLMQALLTRGLTGRHKQFKQSEIGVVPDSWQVSPLGHFIQCGPDNGLYRPQKDYGKGTPILRIDAFENGDRLRRPRLRRVSLDTGDAEKYAVKTGDILINRVNSLSHLGKCALVDSCDETTVFESNMMRLSLDESRVTAEFGFLWLASEQVKAHLGRKAKRAVAQASINQRDVATIPTPCPPRSEQQEIAEIAGSIGRRLEAEAEALAGLREMKSALLSVLLSGELRVPRTPRRHEPHGDRLG